MDSGSGNAGNDIIGGDVCTVLQKLLLPSSGSAANNVSNELLIRRTGPSGVRQLMADNNNNDGFLDAGDSFDSFELQDNTDVAIRGRSMNHRFYVASNVAFNLFAQAQNLQTSGDFTGLDLQIKYLRVDSAQRQHLDQLHSNQLDLLPNMHCFATASGSGGYDLSMSKGHIETDVTYMIYVP